MDILIRSVYDGKFRTFEGYQVEIVSRYRRECETGPVPSRMRIAYLMLLAGF